MIIITLTYLLFVSALTMRKENTIYYTRNIISTLLLSCYICYNNLHIISLEKGIGLYGGIFNVTPISQSFNLFILVISSIILIYNSFYHRTLMANATSWIQNIILRKGNYNVLSMGDTKMEIYKIIEYPLIILFIITGALFLMSSADLISIFISIELQSYGLYILSTLHRDSEQSTWGGLTYFLLGGLSSCFILLGSALLYINSGTTSLDGIYIMSTISDIVPGTELFSKYVSEVYTWKNYTHPTNVFDYHYIDISLIILSVGFLFKVSAAPFHFWSPDVYDAIPTTVTTYVAIIAKISIFIFLLEIVYFVNNDDYYFSWRNCLLISSLFSLIIGSVLGLTQFRIKRVYAYSTISHVGFILLALCVNNTESIQAYIFYIITYTISNLNAFVILVTIGYTMYLYLLKQEQPKTNNDFAYTEENKSLNSTLANAERVNYSILSNKSLSPNSMKQGYGNKKALFDAMQEITELSTDLHNNKVMSFSRTFGSLIDNSKEKSSKPTGEGLPALPLKDINNSPIQLVSQLKGYFYINSYLSLSLAITLFSFIGIPPLVGFFAKQMVLSAALDNGYIFITLIAILTSVIGAVYYLNIVKQMFFFNSDYTINPFINTYNFFGTLKKVSWSFANRNNQSQNNPGYFIYNGNHITINSALSSMISIMTLLLLLFIFTPNESFNLAKILSVLLFN